MRKPNTAKSVRVPLINLRLAAIFVAKCQYTNIEPSTKEVGNTWHKDAFVAKGGQEWAWTKVIADLHKMETAFPQARVTYDLDGQGITVEAPSIAIKYYYPLEKGDTGTRSRN